MFNYQKKLKQINSEPNVFVLLDHLGTKHINHQTRLEYIEIIKQQLKNK